jgi:hypothetical protein
MRRSFRLDEKIRMDLEETGCEVVDWIQQIIHKLSDYKFLKQYCGPCIWLNNFLSMFASGPFVCDRCKDKRVRFLTIS